MNNPIENILESKRKLAEETAFLIDTKGMEAEGGCGVIGFCCTKPVPGKHIYEPSRLMHNRGNGKGGGIAAVGFIPEQLGVTKEILEDHYMLHVAYLDPESRTAVENKYILNLFDVHKTTKLDTVDDWKTVPGLAVKPPDVYRYFVRVKKIFLINLFRNILFKRLINVMQKMNL